MSQIYSKKLQAEIDNFVMDNDGADLNDTLIALVEVSAGQLSEHQLQNISYIMRLCNAITMDKTDQLKMRIAM